MKLSEVIIALEEGKTISRDFGSQIKFFYKMVEVEEHKVILSWRGEDSFREIDGVKAETHFLLNLGDKYEIA